MLHKTKGIVVSYVRYRETSIVVKIYTERFGVQTYIENGVRSSRGKNKIALFQPLTLLDLVVYHDTKKEVHRISEIKCHHPFRTLPFDVRKSSIALFLNELLNKTLKEQEANQPLFDFLFVSILLLDELPNGYENFHLIFLVKFSFFLGFSPQNAAEMEAQFQEFAVPIRLLDTQKKAINELLFADFTSHLVFDRTTRNQVLDALLFFYKLHIENFSDIKSLTVLREVLA